MTKKNDDREPTYHTYDNLGYTEISPRHDRKMTPQEKRDLKEWHDEQKRIRRNGGGMY